MTGYLDPATGRIDLDAVPHDDEATFRLIRSTHTLGLFQIESPGQRELVGKFAPETFGDLIIDISLFRPGPVKSDMVTPFLLARQGWGEPRVPAPEPGAGAARDPRRRGLPRAGAARSSRSPPGCTPGRGRRGAPGAGLARRASARSRPGGGRMRPARGYDADDVERIWQVLKAFASFGFCKAHAAAFALPTYQSAWLKAHHPAAFLAGVLTHDPGMYPKRLILDDARNLGHRRAGARRQRLRRRPTGSRRSPGGTSRRPAILDQVDAGRAGPPDAGRRHADPRAARGACPTAGPTASGSSLADVKGICGAEVPRIVAGRPYHSLADFWHRAQVSRPVVERLVVAGAFDALYGLGLARCRCAAAAG